MKIAMKKVIKVKRIQKVLKMANCCSKSQSRASQNLMNMKVMRKRSRKRKTPTRLKRVVKRRKGINNSQILLQIRKRQNKLVQRKKARVNVLMMDCVKSVSIRMTTGKIVNLQKLRQKKRMQMQMPTNQRVAKMKSGTELLLQASSK